MLMGFNNIAQYKKCIGKDRTNKLQYDEPVDIKVRYCGEKLESVNNGGLISTEHSKIYHSSIKIYTNDILDSHRVKTVSESVDIRGRHHLHLDLYFQLFRLPRAGQGHPHPVQLQHGAAADLWRRSADLQRCQ